MDRSVERAARNEATFREANEKIAGAARKLEIAWRAPFLCECEDEACGALVRLSLEEYQEVRSSVAWFALAPGHRFQSGHVVGERDGYMVVEKTGIARQIAEDQRV